MAKNRDEIVAHIGNIKKAFGFWDSARLTWNEDGKINAIDDVGNRLYNQ